MVSVQQTNILPFMLKVYLCGLRTTLHCLTPIIAIYAQSLFMWIKDHLALLNSYSCDIHQHNIYLDILYEYIVCCNYNHIHHMHQSIHMQLLIASLAINDSASACIQITCCASVHCSACLIHFVNLTVHYSVDEQESPFTVAENELFEQRYTEGYDLTIDPRYNKWLQAHHPDATILAHIPQVSKGMYIIIYIHSVPKPLLYTTYIKLHT